MNSNSLRAALLRSARDLSRYDPLERILLQQDFAQGFHGWQTYFPDYDGWTDYPGRYPPVEPLQEILEKSRRDPAVRIDRRLPVGPRGVPMLSSSPSAASGGAYALKVPTLARIGSKVFAQKRLGSPWRGQFRLECYFAFEAACDVAALYLTCDVMDDPGPGQPRGGSGRWWPAVRYLNVERGELVQKWQTHQGGAGVKDGPWQDIPAGAQALGAAAGGLPPPWHYLRFTFDLARHEYLDFYCSGREFPVAGLSHRPDPPLAGWRASTDKCPGLIGTGFGVETATDKRCFLYLDSVLVSATAA
jgi:hypothetical protein